MSCNTQYFKTFIQERVFSFLYNIVILILCIGSSEDSQYMIYSNKKF